ncbi:MAG: GH92 family glycosyl hydrolase [Chloracidobacterium sp.]|nr:GH92 family glycosyl hydrolase [Chloracidobacterium sp.]
MGQAKGNSKKIKGKRSGNFSASLRLCGFLLLLTAYCLLPTAVAAQTLDYTRYVNPFIGTGGHGHTFPGATMPFGMVQLSPDTRIDNWDGSAGYHYSDDIIYGFSHTHLSGTGIPDGCDILFMPTMGNTRYFEKLGDKAAGVYGSKFSHANERAEPGYYTVRLDDEEILAELTATNRVGLHRYTFPKSGKASVKLNMTWRDKPLDIKVRTINERRIEGYRRSTSWAKDQTIYFVAEFSKPFGNGKYKKWIDEDVTLFPGSTRTIGYSTAFDFTVVEGEQIQLKVGISFVSIEGARKNLEAEMPNWDFDTVRADAKAAWNKELSKIEVSGGTPEQTTNFYTALYHTMIHPNVFNDVDGRYKGHDGKLHQLTNRRDAETQRGIEARGNDLKTSASLRLSGESSDHYSVFSLWDTFRAAHPLYTIIDQKRTVDYINTFIRIYEQGGRLPVWELWGEETDTMIGYHAVSVIADAMAKGIKGFDYEEAYAAAKHSAELDHFGLAGYKKRGYISMEDENESVSKTLEYAYNDWCIAQMAKILKKPADVETYDRRSRYFEDLFDTKTGFFRAKKNAGFVEPFSPTEVNFGFTEGNSWQYSFFVPQDVSHLMTLMGGPEKFVAKLDELFTTNAKLSGREQADLTGLIGQYAHGNEPSHHIAYLYNYAQEPWKTQKYVRQIFDDFYKNAPDGLIGNEDCGQMSAWYIMSAGGFYPVAPGSPVYAFGTPLFPEMTYRLENGKTFTNRAKNISSENRYILNAKLNGAPYKKAFITHQDVMRGGVLEFSMIDQPVETAFNEFPVSSIGINTVAVPVITGERTFANSSTVTISTLTPNAKVHFTTDGSVPTKASKVFTAPFSVDRTTTVKAVAIGANGTASFPVEAVLTRRPHDWTVKVLTPYSTQYTGGGENAIIDGIRGTTNFASGEWQGIQGKPYEAVIDLRRETTISEVGASFLQVVGPWIWMPSNIKFEISNNGSDWSEVASIKTDVAVTDMKPQIRDYYATITPVTARYVRVRADNIGKIPSWHPGAGGDPWIFVDEVFIQ